MIKSFSLRSRSSRSACFVFVFFLLLFRLLVGRRVEEPLRGILGLCGWSSYDLRSQSHLGVLWEIPMTYDLKVILKYCGRSSHDLLVLCGWSWPLLGVLLGRSWPLFGQSCRLLEPPERPGPPREAQNHPQRPQEQVKTTHRGPGGHGKISHNTSR